MSFMLKKSLKFMGASLPITLTRDFAPGHRREQCPRPPYTLACARDKVPPLTEGVQPFHLEISNTNTIICIKRNIDINFLYIKRSDGNIKLISS